MLRKEQILCTGETSEKTVPRLDLARTIAGQLFVCQHRPWEAIGRVSNHIYRIGGELSFEQYDEIAQNVWVHVSAYLAPSVKINPPAIIGAGARICHGAYLDGSIIGSFAKVGEMSSIKDSILFDRAGLEGHDHICSSILGYGTRVGAGVVVNDTRLDGKNVLVDMPEGVYISGRRRLGAVICDGAKIGSLCSISAGSVIESDTVIKPMSIISGYVRI